jgi:hypothetical protein
MDRENVVMTSYTICALFTKCYERVQVKRTWRPTAHSGFEKFTEFS